MRKGSLAYREYHRRKSKEHYEAHKEEYKQRFREWKQKNREKIVCDPKYYAKYREKFGEFINMRTRENNRQSMKCAVRSGAKWTPEEYELLRQLIMEGKEYEEIGMILGRSIKAVEHAKKREFPELVTEARKRHNYVTGEVMEDEGY